MIKLLRVHINREKIVATAVNLLDDYGLADTTMRRVASQLQVAPGALYWHIANKQALIAAIADHIIAPLQDQPSGATATELALLLRACLLSHRDGAEVTLAGLSQPGNETWQSLVSLFAQAFTNQGLTPDCAHSGARAVVHLVLGNSMMEQSATQLVQAASSKSWANSTRALITDGAGVEEITRGVDIIAHGLFAYLPPKTGN